MAIELDGGQHFEPAALAYDERRTAYLRRQGVTVIRFPTDLVFRQADAVLDEIARAVGLLDGPSP